MKLFISEEEISRGYFADFLTSLDKEFTYEEMPITCVIDGYLTVGNNRLVIEIKGRDKYYEGWDTHLMEIQKYEDMKARGKNGMYACFFGDDTLYLYSLNQIKDNSKIKNIPCPITTADSDRSSYVLKPCYLIDKRIARVYKKINGKWSRQEN